MVGDRFNLRYILTIAAAIAAAPEGSMAARNISSPSPLIGAVVPASLMKVQLAWTDVSGETGYLIERRTSGGSFVEMAKVGSDVKIYIDVTLASQTYEYRVRAYKIRSGNMIYSEYSNSVAVETGGGTNSGTGTGTDPC
jgi:hypothetical protein